MNRPAKHHCSGFTLVEILIAVLIFSIIIFTLFSSFKAFIVSSEAVKKQVAHDEKISRVFKRISMDLESIFVLQPPRYKKPGFDSDPDPYGFTGKEGAVGQQVVSSMAFTSGAHAKFGANQRDGIARIVYYLKENKKNRYDLYRADSLPPFPEETASCLDPVLCQDISGFDMIYKDVNKNEYRYWDSDAEEFNHMFPASIDFKITVGSGEKQQAFILSIGLLTGRGPT
ncbi:type II secretion system protein J [Desulfobacula sp.]|uniref:PulJ/GspJ family protein n=1 Tax=Desulfobacula sp. TaxID=2593537 RepID=UPI0025C5055B|nr:prepilin-type N-terminal cleavage/methylation domain-containing protein [Desulfobacula sp.]MBC2704555.1 prepilin-type N-terminal cleavage/methylation domain-containing protein [Desulfobacula sp.]